MALADLITAFNNAKKKKNYDSTFLSLLDVLEEIQDGGTGGGMEILYGFPNTPVRATTGVGSGSNNLLYRVFTAGESGNEYYFAVDGSVGAGKENRELTVAMVDQFRSVTAPGKILLITLATDGSGALDASVNTYENVANASYVNQLPIELVATLNDPTEELSYDADATLFGSGQDGVVGLPGQIMLGEGDVFISLGDSTATQSYWEKLQFDISNDILGGAYWLMNANEQQTVDGEGGEWGGTLNIGESYYTNFNTRGSEGHNNLEFGLEWGQEIGQLARVEYGSHSGPTIDSLVLLTNNEGSLPIYDSTNTILLDNLLFIGTGAWMELEWKNDAERWLLKDSYYIWNAPTPVPGVVTQVKMFRPNIVENVSVLVGYAPRGAVTIFERPVVNENRDYIVMLGDGNVYKQIVTFKVADFASLEGSSTITLQPDHPVQGEGSIEYSEITFGTGAELVLEWDLSATCWRVVYEANMTLTEVH